MDKLPDVWVSRDLPVLHEVARRVDAGETPSSEDIAAAIGLTPREVVLAGRALRRQGLVGVQETYDGEAVFGDISGDAYVVTGLHPNGDELVSQLISALRQAADRHPDPEEKSRLRRIADQAGIVSRDTLAAVLAAVVTGAAG